MIKVEKSSDKKITKISGSECEMMLFYCFWQSKLWPDWMNYANLGNESDSVTWQHKLVIENVNAGRELLFNDVGEQFETACQYAINRCCLLGIDVNVL